MIYPPTPAPKRNLTVAKFDLHLFVFATPPCRGLYWSRQVKQDHIQDYKSRLIVSDPLEGCVFPFTYKEMVFKTCTDLDHEQPWCAMTSEYKKKQWMNCPTGTKSRYRHIKYTKVVTFMSIQDTLEYARSVPQNFVYRLNILKALTSLS